MITWDPYSEQVDATGAATITISPTKVGVRWMIRQVGTELIGTAPSGAAAAVRLNGYLITPIVAQADAAAGDPPIPLRGGSDKLTVEWTGCTPGQVAQALVIYDDGQPDR